MVAGHVRVGEAAEDFHQACFVMVEVARPGAVLFLVDFGASGHAFGPGQGQIERAPLHDGAAQERSGGLDGPVAGDAEKGIGEMAKHAVSGHAAPPAGAIGFDGGEADG